MMTSRNSSIIGSTAAADWMLFRMLSCVCSSDEPEMSPTTALLVVNVLGPSLSSSDALAWPTGERESTETSASWCCFPGTHLATNMNLVIWSFRRKRRRLSSLSSEYSLRIGTSGRWSVMRLKVCRPWMNCLHFLMAQAAAKHSSSIMAYLLSAGDNRESGSCLDHPPLVCVCVSLF